MAHDRTTHIITSQERSVTGRWLTSLMATPSHTKLGQVMRLPLRLIPTRTVVPIVQGKLRGKKWVVGSSNHGCWLGTYEVDLQRAFARHVSPGSVVYDIGANVGYYTLLSSVLTGPDGIVVAFEPLPRNVEHLRRHLSLNRVANVILLEAAVGDTAGTVSFKVGPTHAMGKINSDGDLTVRGVTLDLLVYEEAMKVPDVIKVDVEGGEYVVLRGATRVLSEHHPVIFLATHGAEVHDECCRYLTQLGYDLTPIRGESLEATSEIIARIRSN